MLHNFVVYFFEIIFPCPHFFNLPPSRFLIFSLCIFPSPVSPTCPLERLILRNADVDDFECERFVEAIKCNSSLVELDLSNNKIGSAENLNTVMPDLITGVSKIVKWCLLFFFDSLFIIVFHAYLPSTSLSD